MQHAVGVTRVDRFAESERAFRLPELFVIGDISRVEIVGCKRELEASLESGPDQPSYAEAILVQAARLLNDLGELWLVRRTTSGRRSRSAYSHPSGFATARSSQPSSPARNICR
jgi:hypothetical protein